MVKFKIENDSRLAGDYTFRKEPPFIKRCERLGEWKDKTGMDLNEMSLNKTLSQIGVQQMIFVACIHDWVVDYPEQVDFEDLEPSEWDEITGKFFLNRTIQAMQKKSQDFAKKSSDLIE